MDTLSILLPVCAVMFFGLFFYWKFQWKHYQRNTLTLDAFFLGSGTAGAKLTKDDNWGLCFAFANAIWYYAFLGYSFGWVAILLQIPWSLAIIVAGYFLPQYIAGSTHGTVHGFIRFHYGGRTALLAAIATLIGYVVNCGFELFFSVFLLCVAFGVKQYTVPFSILLALLVAAYSVAGGYTANARTDSLKNKAGVASSVILIVLLFLAISAGADGFVSTYIAKTSGQFVNPPWYTVLGVSIFAFFFNFVDMANWQSFAANRKYLETPELKKIQRGLYSSAWRQMVAPAVLGVTFGVLLRVLGASDNNEVFFKIFFDQGVFNNAGVPILQNKVVAGLLLGVLLFGFVSMTISSVISYLIAAVQTLACDVVHRAQYAKAREDATPKKERDAIEARILKWTMRYIYMLATAMVVVFATLYYASEGSSVVFDFQFVMYGAATTLVPAVGLGFLKSGKYPDLPLSNDAAFLSILLGLVMVLGPFLAAEFFWTHPMVAAMAGMSPVEISKDAVVSLTPALGLVTGCIVCTLGLASGYLQRARSARKMA